MQNYRELEVWNVAMEFAESVYRITRKFPADKKFGLTSQLRRAVVSVPSNIAEGFGRTHRAEYLNHLSIARGSLLEAETQLTLSVRLGYTDRHTMLPTWDLAQRTGQMLSKLITSLKSKKDPRPTTRSTIDDPRSTKASS